MGFQWNPQGGSSLHFFQVELEFGNVGFCGGRKTGVPREKPSEQEREPTTNSTHIMTPSLGIEPGLHWREACVGGECSTTAPSLLPQYDDNDDVEDDRKAKEDVFLLQGIL